MTALAPRFHARSQFAPPARYRLLPFRFGRLDENRYIVTNDVGEYVLLSRDDLVAFTRRELPSASDAYRALKARHFLFDEQSECALDLVALKYRTRAEQIANFTGLHIFVVTLRCDHSCHYCQVSRQTEDRSAFDMSRGHADRALEQTFRSPASHIKIEFQGGEPLLNFDLIQYVVERAYETNRTAGKTLQFVIATNLARLTDEMLAFCKEKSIYFSTSLDGPEELHTAYRPLRGGNSYTATIEGIQRVRNALGPDFVSALMTTTPASLDRIEEIIDEYVRQDFRSIFLRSLSPYGFAVRTSLVRKYGVEDWLAFYKRGLAYILDLNRGGYAFREEFTSIILQKLFSPSGSSYVDLQSPAGIGIGAIIYNYDGAVYASDEGRMLAEMGDHSFRLGQLDTDSYETTMSSDALLAPLEDTLLESSPMCSDCPFLPYCGADPVFHKATQGDHVGHKAFSAFCKKQMGVVRHIISLLEDDPEARNIMRVGLTVLLKLHGRHLRAVTATSDHPFIGRISEYSALPEVARRREILLVPGRAEALPPGFRAYLLHESADDAQVRDAYILSQEMRYLAHGDIVRIEPKRGSVSVLYRRSSPSNSLLVTEQCDNYCVMCSQPPKHADDSWIAEELKEVIPLISPETPEIGITGGEPALLGDRLVEVLEQLRAFLPRTALHILSNGRRFSDAEFSRKVARVRHPDLMIGIPLYSDLPEDHDYVVQARGAFSESVRGILNLKTHRVKVEVRFVIQADTYQRLPDFARFLARNLLFVDHVALMGLELMGFAKANLDAIWIDPVDYQEQLATAVQILDRAGMSVSIYNHQLCVLDPRLHSFARKSISDWKNAYFDECTGCTKKAACGGFFASSAVRKSRGIAPVLG